MKIYSPTNRMNNSFGSYLQLSAVIFYVSTLQLANYPVPLIGINFGTFSSMVITLVLFPYFFHSGIPRGITVPMVILLIWTVSLSFIVSFDYDEKYISAIVNISCSYLLCSYIIKNPKAYLVIIISFIVTSTIVSFLLKNNLLDVRDGRRVTMENVNANLMAVFPAFSAVALVYILLIWKKIWCFILIAPILLNLITLSNTGSRGGFISVIIGVSVIFLYRKGRIVTKIIFIAIGAVAVMYLSDFLLSNSEVLSQRMSAMVEEGASGGRNEIWGAALKVFMDYPLGIGSADYMSFLQEHLGYRVDTHNMYLFILITGGIIGITIFGLFLYRLSKIVITEGVKSGNTLIIAFLFMMLFHCAKSGGVFYQKVVWFVFAYALGTAISLRNSRIVHNNMRDNVQR